MTRILLAAVTALTLAAPLATSASADTIDDRQAYQQRRIQEGVRSGEINRWEYRRLQAEQARIADLERRAKADGYLSSYERDRLRQAQNEASRHIYQESHDSERRRRWWRWWY
jgi:hypothetical protein